MQSAKIIDVTRSFVPVDPNAYPENMHGTEKEDSPERRVPVIPYIGHNFLPTGYGYKSYFGTNNKIDIDPLLPADAKPDHVFMFQTTDYKNIFIALCDTGIWVKASNSAGAWTSFMTLTPPAEDVFFEWSYCTIKNKLYCYRSNDALYYRIETDIAETLGISITAVSPTFITATAQLGMFKLGNRLAFWDGENAIAFSSPDDLGDFTPSVTTGANVTTFSSVLGKIAAIRPQGRNAIVYATGSVVELQVNPAETFFVKAKSIISDSGCAYKKQSVEANPDETHFAYTSTGIFKITAGKEELIIPEVFDYLKPYTAQPIYLKLLEGRFLCFEIIDVNAVNGKAQFSKEEIPATSILFPGYDSLEDVNAADIADVDICQVTKQLTSNAFAEAQSDADAAVPPAQRYPGSDVIPLYTCYISQAAGPVDPITWGHSPCGPSKIATPGQYWEMSPSTNAGKLSQWTTDATNKTAKTGAEVWTDGKWTMERFVTYQSAIWKSQEEAMAAYVSAIENRPGGSESTTSGPTNSCVASGPTLSYCTIGRYPTEFSDYQFGFNKCSFWLTRYAIGAKDLKTRTSTTITCTNNTTQIPVTHYIRQGFPGTTFASPEAVAASLGAGYIYVPNGSSANTLGGAGTSTGSSNIGYCTHTSSGGTIYVEAIWLASPSKILTQISAGVIPTVGEHYASGYYDQTTAQGVSNIGEDVDPLTPTPETAWCELTGYQYTDLNGATQTAAVPGGCANTDDKYPGSTTMVRQVPSDAARPNHLDPDTGAFCGIPLEQPDIGDEVSWPDQTVTYPASSFLLQLGSIAPRNPTFTGSLVYDLHLKKWGKMKLEYKQLLDYSPINSSSSSLITFTNFGILAGVFKDDGYIYLFDTEPADSLLTWGKVGYYRAGMTDAEEIRMDFASLSSGTCIVDVSLDGQATASDLSYTEAFVSQRQLTVYPPYSGKWFNVSLTGQFDVSFIEFKALHKGRR